MRVIFIILFATALLAVAKGQPLSESNEDNDVGNENEETSDEDSSDDSDDDETKTDPEKICDNDECKRIAEKLTKMMDEENDPCDNFYKFACGKFDDIHQIPVNETFINYYSILQDKVFDRLKIIMEKKLSKPSKAYKLVKSFYQSCMENEKTREEGIEYIKKELEKFGGWLVPEGNETQLNEFKTQYLKYMMSIKVEKEGNTKKRIIHIGKPTTEGKKNIFGNLNSFLNYFTEILDAFKNLGDEDTISRTELSKSLLFEKKLYEIDPKDGDDESKYRVPIKNLQRNYSSIPWTEIISDHLSLEVNDNEEVLFTEPWYFKGLVDLLESTPLRVQANYTVWKYLSRLTTINDNFLKDFKLQSKKCVSLTAALFPVKVGSMYRYMFVPEQDTKPIQEMTRNIAEQMKTFFENASWMSAETEGIMNQKISTMINHISHQTESLEKEEIDDYYESLNISKNASFIENLLKVIAFNDKKKNELLRLTVDGNIWNTYDITKVTAEYNYLENSIYIPAAILRGIFYHKDRPLYMNYGTLGRIIGREISRAVYEEGRKRNEQEDSSTWWSDNYTIKNSAQCFVKQYEEYNVGEEDMKIDGTRTLKENIADYIGTKIAYLAYSDNEEEYGKEFLPEMEKYTPKQMFWISAAISECAKYTEKGMEELMVSGEHSPPEFRIVGTLSNIPEFAEDFKCSEESKMNLTEKCSME